LKWGSAVYYSTKFLFTWFVIYCNNPHAVDCGFCAVVCFYCMNLLIYSRATVSPFVYKETSPRGTRSRNPSLTAITRNRVR
ncbi:hypothetical protein C0J52_08584, partial [Blattella germanica]